MLIRRYVPEDMPAVLASEEAYPDAWSPTSFETFLAIPDCAIYVIGDVDGYVVLETLPAYLHIAKLAVKPGLQGRGLGTMLLKFAIAKHPVSRLHVRCNNPALKLYTRLGFRVIDYLPDYYSDGGDAFLMEKS